MFSKKGQLTIFIIIAILIIAGVSLFFVFRGGIGKKEAVSPEVVPIQNFVQECLDDSLEKVVFQVGENGGYYFLGNVPRTSILEVPYYIKNNKNLMPSKENIENEISKGISRELILCFGNFALFSEYNITKGALTATSKIEQEKVLVDVKYPLTIKKGDSKSKLEDFESEVPVRLGIIYDAAAEFVKQQLESRAEKICVDCILVSFAPQGLKSNIFWEDNKTSIFIVRDLNSIVNEKEFVFNFAGEF